MFHRATDSKYLGTEIKGFDHLATSHPTKTGLKGQFAGLNVTAVFQSLRLERGCTCMKEGGYWKEGIYI